MQTLTNFLLCSSIWMWLPTRAWWHPELLATTFCTFMNGRVNNKSQQPCVSSRPLEPCSTRCTTASHSNVWSVCFLFKKPAIFPAPLSVDLSVPLSGKRCWNHSTAGRSVYLGGRLGHILSRQFPIWATTSLTSSVDSSFREKDPRSYSMDSCKSGGN